ncbi:BTB/POZ domain-containing protein [Megavirus baoshan]|uniref:BTB/POZ domain-containing protein n=1 Tax=Megavirus baoshan TaxID=2496520 RepID=A0A3S8UYW0_9VIRU|nr:BTB/POZ domain-containing protein [Megavirus baoshan]AZL89858.1 BTB/POZ domain-containing protein [Megavirus baoshan]
MNFIKLYESGELSDIEIFLIDDKNKKCLKYHKVILYNGSPFFQKMFTASFKEKDQTQITLKVFDVDVFIDILKSFYGIEIAVQTSWKYQLTNYICRQYLLLDCKLPETLKVPENEFEEFLEITQSLEYTDEVVNLIKENLPLDFDLDKLSIELIKEIEKKYIDYQILVADSKGISIIDNNKINTIIKGNFSYLDYIKDLDIIIVKNRKFCGYSFYDLEGNIIDLSKTNENNKKYKYLSKNLDSKHFGNIGKLLGNLRQDFEYYNYSSDYKNIVLVCCPVREGDIDSEDDKYNKYKSRSMYIYNIRSRKIKIIYKIKDQNQSTQIQDQPLFVKDKIIFLEGDFINSKAKIYSTNDKIVKTICKINDDFAIIAYNGDDLILISANEKNKVYSLSKNKIVNKFNFESELWKVDFVSEETIIASKSTDEKTHIYIYNIMTGDLIKNLTINIPANHIKCIPIISSIKNKLRNYLNDSDNH